MSGIPCLACCHCDPTQAEEGGWINGWTLNAGLRLIEKKNAPGDS